MMTPTGLEPAMSCLKGRCFIPIQLRSLINPTGVEPVPSPYKDAALPLCYGFMMNPEGVEPSLSAYQAGSLPLTYGFFIALGRIELPSSA